MSADFSRQRFNPIKNLSGVLMQQGRVQLDADWNEFVEILDRRFRAETTDIIGRCVVPRERPESFEITIAGNDLNIGPGRIYVDGLLAENHGDSAATAIFDEVLGELRGKNPVLYTGQPYLPSATLPDLAQTLPLLVYIDVWEREVTFIEDPELVEKAVGVDTTARVQTIWQVKVLPVGVGATCGGTIPAWDDLIKPSAGRLSTDAHGVPSTTDPCLIPPTGGYLGLENQLYRVEIHSVDASGNATFKWSRDNASVATNVSFINPAGTELTVDSVGRDSVLCFQPGDWIEITDDVRELAGQAGVMQKVLLVGEKTITLAQPLTGNELPDPDPTRHARIRRWDQSGTGPDTTGGVIPVPAAGTPVLLENGVEVKFSLDPNIVNGKFHVGDYWVFAARTADASVEQLRDAAPRGIHHHYGRLAIVTSFSTKPTDCRVFWPPEEEKGCDCSVCVTAESHKMGTLTIQHAIDQIKDVGGTVCLGPGLYHITSTNPVRFDGAKSVRIKGQSWLTILFSMEGPGVVISNSLRVTVEDLSVVTVRSNLSRLAVEITNSTAVTVQRCAIVQWSAEIVGVAAQATSGAAIGLSGFVIETRICDNVIFGANGVTALLTAVSSGTVAAPPLPLIGALRIQDNLIYALSNGIALGETVLHLAENRLAGNFITGCTQAGIDIRGKVVASEFPGSRLDIHRNIVRSAGNGIVIATGETRITDNDIAPNSNFVKNSGPVTTPESAGILLTRNSVAEIDHCQILENRVSAVGGVGIGIETTVHSAMIKQNIIDGAAGGGIVMDAQGKTSADILTIENNQILNVAGSPEKIASRTGIAVATTQQAAIVGNTVIGVGFEVENANRIAGIAVSNSKSIRISGNAVLDIGPRQAVKQGDGIVVFGFFDRVDVIDNEVQRQRALPPQGDNATWHALSIGDPEKSSGAKLVMENESTRFILLSTGIFKLARNPQTISVRGNVFAAYGSASSIIVATSGACLFSDNRCLLVAANKFQVAQIRGGAIIANANYFERSVTKGEAVVDLVQAKNRVTVLGNISNGLIHVNGIALAPTWEALNIMTP